MEQLPDRAEGERAGLPHGGRDARDGEVHRPAGWTLRQGEMHVITDTAPTSWSPSTR